MEHGIPEDILRRLLEVRNIAPKNGDGVALARLFEDKENTALPCAAETGRILRLAVRECSRNAHINSQQ